MKASGYEEEKERTLSKEYPYYYAWGTSPMRPIDRKGQLCRVVCRGTMNSCLLEFEDGFQVVTSRNALRKVKP